MNPWADWRDLQEKPSAEPYTSDSGNKATPTAMLNTKVTVSARIPKERHGP